jgi:hypothetical protein
MPDLVDETLTLIRRRLTELKPSVEEYHRLRAAGEALGGLDGSPRRTPRPRRDRKSSTVSQRAPRGQNREKALAVIGERPGVTVTELAEVTGIGKPTLYNLAHTLAEKGEVEKLRLPGGQTGFRLAG